MMSPNPAIVTAAAPCVNGDSRARTVGAAPRMGYHGEALIGGCMDRGRLRTLLELVREGGVPVDDALERIATLTGGELGFAHLDLHRSVRTGLPEVVFGEGKDAAQIAGLFARLRDAGHDAVATRVSAEKAAIVQDALPEAVYHAMARVLHLPGRAASPPEVIGRIAVICAGTSDLPVAEEAAVIAEIFGNPVDRVRDVGVAGLHRLLNHVPVMRQATAIVVVAGMEGALPSVVAGLVDRPVIAVPTSVGYGASFKGLSALLTMLNSCAAGISVVNIDNGFGAAVQASLINRAPRGAR